ncbi:YihY family inner membrane protein [Halorhodospira halochloris]|uniref:YihY family inner membrane protein n=1 Tax=Halorhodospira halochloris TaxID=1052 RepID=UPI001EE96912|nr:YihY family inner membrane protein [Halorhodospira halochloris]MCG5548783.1 YihY family inner membrane protein [Halorhodospira halochloris]
MPRLPQLSVTKLKPVIDKTQDFGAYLLQRISADECLKSAAMLAYVTLLAIVPLLTIAFSVLAAFPVFEGMTDRLRELMVEHLVPAASEVVDDHLESFVGRAAELTAVGVVGLAVSSLLLLNTAERVLNGIWGVSQPRPAMQRIMVYWTVLTVGPLMIGAAIVATPGIGGLAIGPVEVEPTSAMVSIATAVAPFLVQAVIFTLIYALVPNRPVRLLHAVVGGAMASLLFEVAKFGFAKFVSTVPTYEAIYGALAALPLFLIWLYISWLVILVGAEIAHALDGYRRRADLELSDQRWEMVLAIRLLGHLFNAQRQGEAIDQAGLLELEPEAGEQAVERVLTELRRAKIVDQNWQGKWVLIRDMASFTLEDLHRTSAFRLPSSAEIGEQGGLWERRLADRVRRLEERREAIFEISLSELFASSRG